MTRWRSPILLAAALVLGAPAPAAAAKGPTPFTCCDNSRVSQILREYLRVQGSLAEPESATKHQAYLSALRSVLQPGGLPADEARLVRELRALVQRISARPADEVRAEFAELSRAVIFLALRHEGGSRTVAEAWCPGRGPWLQRDLERPRDPWEAGCGRWR